MQRGGDRCPLLAVEVVHQVGVCLRDTFDCVNSGEYQRREGVLVGNFDNGENVWLSPAWIDRLDLLNLVEGFHDIGGLPGENVD